MGTFDCEDEKIGPDMQNEDLKKILKAKRSISELAIPPAKDPDNTEQLNHSPSLTL